MVAAMLISAGNFLFGNLAVREIDPAVLAFWRNAIALGCTLPFVLRARPDLVGYFRRQGPKLLVLSALGSVLTAWLMYLSLRSNDLINLGVGYTLIPLMTVLFSALLLAERLSSVQYLGFGIAFLGAVVFAFQGDPALLLSFDPHEAFLWMVAVCMARSLYLVLLKRWDAPGAGRGPVRAAGDRDGAAAARLRRARDRERRRARLFLAGVGVDRLRRHRHGRAVSAPDQLRHRADRPHQGVLVHLHRAAVRHGRGGAVPRQPAAGLSGARGDPRGGRGVSRVMVP
jgi:uncharacterized membrane protein